MILLPLILTLTITPLFAQLDLSGTWAARNFSDELGNRPGPGPGPDDWLGIPLNEFGIAKALSYSPSQISMPDRICSVYTSAYLAIGPFGLKLWNETEPLNGTTVSWNIGGWEDMGPITIWMDGRPHPSKSAPHEKSGFTTGVWENDVLTAYTTHLKAGYIRRSGAPSSDLATITTKFSRHDDILTVTERIDDPVFLSEPYYLTRTFQLIDGIPMNTVGQPCLQDNEGVKERVVPHFLPGENPFLNDLQRDYNIPAEAIVGGAKTMYPDYRKQLLKDKYIPPAKCTRYCGGPGISR